MRYFIALLIFLVACADPSGEDPPACPGDGSCPAGYTVNDYGGTEYTCIIDEPYDAITCSMSPCGSILDSDGQRVICLEDPDARCATPNQPQSCPAGYSVGWYHDNGLYECYELVGSDVFVCQAPPCDGGTRHGVTDDRQTVVCR